MKILLVAYAYGTSPIHVFTGSQRAFSFAKYLSRQGMEIVVISFRDTLGGFRRIGKFGERIYRALDFFCTVERFFQNLKPISNQANSPPEAVTINAVRHSINWHKRLFYIPDRQWLWAITAYLAAIGLHKREQFDVVLTTSPPESVHWVGWLLKKSKGIPWIADMRDGWMFEPYLEIRQIKGLRKRIELAMERFLISQADSVSTVTQPLIDDLADRLSVPRNKAFLIPNGFDIDEWNIPGRYIDEARNHLEDTKNKMLMVHMGRLSAARIDRDASPFFRALHSLKTSNPSLSNELAIFLVGTTQGSEVDIVESLDLADVVHFHPLLPKPEAIATMKAADVLLLVTSPSQKSIATSKLFDYMAADKPVLALAQGNAAAEIVMQTGIGLTVSPTNISEIANAIENFLLWWKQGSFPFDPKQDQISSYSRENQAAKMAEVLKTVY